MHLRPLRFLVKVWQSAGPLAASFAQGKWIWVWLAGCSCGLRTPARSRSRLSPSGAGACGWEIRRLGPWLAGQELCTDPLRVDWRPREADLGSS